MVKTTTTTITEMPQWSGNASIRGFATNTQKTTTGTMMTDIVRKMDLTSGPNMNLPCKKNSCKQKKSEIPAPKSQSHLSFKRQQQTEKETHSYIISCIFNGKACVHSVS
jgi:hypothetical protein